MKNVNTTYKKSTIAASIMVLVGAMQLPTVAYAADAYVDYLSVAGSTNIAGSATIGGAVNINTTGADLQVNVAPNVATLSTISTVVTAPAILDGSGNITTPAVTQNFSGPTLTLTGGYQSSKATLSTYSGQIGTGPTAFAVGGPSLAMDGALNTANLSTLSGQGVAINGTTGVTTLTSGNVTGTATNGPSLVLNGANNTSSLTTSTGAGMAVNGVSGVTSLTGEGGKGLTVNGTTSTVLTGGTNSGILTLQNGDAGTGTTAGTNITISGSTGAAATVFQTTTSASTNQVTTSIGTSAANSAVNSTANVRAGSNALSVNSAAGTTITGSATTITTDTTTIQGTTTTISSGATNITSSKTNITSITPAAIRQANAGAAIILNGGINAGGSTSTSGNAGVFITGSGQNGAAAPLGGAAPSWSDVSIMSATGTAGIIVTDYGVQIISPTGVAGQTALNGLGNSTGSGNLINTVGAGGGNGSVTTTNIGTGGTSGSVTQTNIGLGGSGTAVVTNNFGSSTGGGNVNNTFGSGALGTVGSVTNNVVGAGGAGVVNNSLGMGSTSVAGGTVNNSIGAGGLGNANNSFGAGGASAYSVVNNVIGAGGTVAGSTVVNAVGTAGVAGSDTTNNIGTGTGGVTTNNIGNTQAGSSVNMMAGSSTMSLSGAGLTLGQTGSGAPIRVMGVAEGTSPTDAVNRTQLNRAYSGIAGVAAMAQIPQPDSGKQLSMGLGMGSYMGEGAIAVGVKYRTKESTSLSFGFTTDSQNRSLVAAGAGWSW